MPPRHDRPATNGDALDDGKGKSPGLAGQKAAVTGPGVQRLCEGRPASQTAAIARIKTLLNHGGRIV